MLAEAAPTSSAKILIEHPVGVLTVLLVVLATVFAAARHPRTGPIFKVVPALLFCYFVPTLLTTLAVIPAKSPAYDWIKAYLLPAGLLLLVLSLDLPGIVRLGPKAGIMLLAGTTGVVLGGPVSLLVFRDWLPPDAWKGMAALAGSWIGGGANYVALGEAAEASDSMLGTIVIVDVLAANVWMSALLYASVHQRAIDRWVGADASAIRDLEQRMADFHARVNRIPSLADLMMILALGFAGCFISYKAGLGITAWLRAHEAWDWVNDSLSETTWKFMIVTALGVGLSFTRVRNLEGAGSSRIGTFFIYLVVTCIGASADFRQIAEYPAYVGMGFLWIGIHVVVLLGVGRLIRAPLFFVAVGSQANIGGAASAPVIASAFRPSLAAVGALLAVAGYVLGTYAGLLCMGLLRTVAPG